VMLRNRLHYNAGTINYKLSPYSQKSKYKILFDN
jgi:hypothetical protein